MNVKISTPWHQRKLARENRESAEREVAVSRSRYNDALNKTLQALHTLQTQNHFAQTLAQQLAKGYDKK